MPRVSSIVNIIAHTLIPFRKEKKKLQKPGSNRNIYRKAFKMNIIPLGNSRINKACNFRPLDKLPLWRRATVRKDDDHRLSNLL